MSPMTWLDAVSLLNIELRVRMSVMLPSTTWPPFFGVALWVPPPPAQASRNSTPPARKAT